ncbi:hypothetical protein GMST_40680 [Geomonas silvestris]|uniref:DUF304 domain-containing protein n=1 Tax=Geomonas silvestris TaxID=2740184 RepID=A0A6V8MPV9_9BACT|nr:hypothetical protein [Geomonas silvestris]GFO61743.1 hypothetical protein GMST_40680 [Geomonas silvestris]
MAQEIQTTVASPDYEIIGKKSWTAYLPLFVVSLLVILLVAPILALISQHLAALFILVITVHLMSSVRALQSIYLYYNRTGVWVSYGFLPWNRGGYGVKWRDLEGAVYYTNFSSWIFKSYTVRISHRFTKTSEIYLTDMARGDLAVSRINELHSLLIGNGDLS